MNVSVPFLCVIKNLSIFSFRAVNGVISALVLRVVPTFVELGLVTGILVRRECYQQKCLVA